MKSRLWLNVALLAAVVALALFAYLKPQDGEPEHRLSVLKTAEAKHISIQIAGAEPMELQRAAPDWLITTPLTGRADSFQIQRLLGILEATSKERYPAIGLARYGLNEPYARLTIDQQTFSFGAVNPATREQYVLTQDGIYLVSLRYGAALPKSALQLASKQLFVADEAPVAFESKEFRVAQQDGKWQLAPAADVSADDITRWVDDWRLASALEVLPPSDHKALMTIAVKLKNGKDITLAVLQREPDLVIARSDQKFEYRFPAAATKRLLMAPTVATDKSPN